MAVVIGPLHSQSAWGTLGKSLTFRRETQRKPARGKIDNPGSGGLQSVETGRGVVTRYTPVVPRVVFPDAPDVEPDGAIGAQITAAQVPRTQRNRRLYKFVQDMLNFIIVRDWESANFVNFDDMKTQFFRHQSANIRRLTVGQQRRFIRADINTSFYYLGVRSIEEWGFRRLAGNGFGFLWWASNEWFRLTSGQRRDWERLAARWGAPVVRDTANPFGFDWGHGFRMAWFAEAFLPPGRGGIRRWFYDRSPGTYMRGGGDDGFIIYRSARYEPDARIKAIFENQFSIRFQFPFLPQAVP